MNIIIWYHRILPLTFVNHDAKLILVRMS